MTDQDRREAERLARDQKFRDGPGRCEGVAFVEGYAAGRESMKATMPEWEVRARLEKLKGKYAEGRAMWERTIDAERARSAKLLDALKFMTMSLGDRPLSVESLLETIANDDQVGLAAIAEYEASRD